MFRHHVDGYALRCEVTENEDGTFRITVVTKRDAPFSKEQHWEMPQRSEILSELDAHRWARYVCSGITHVDPVTGPAYTVF